MGGTMSDGEAEGIGRGIGAESGRVTWVTAPAGTGVSRVVMSLLRQAAESGGRSFVWDPEMAYASAAGLPEGTTVMMKDCCGTDDLVGVASRAAASGIVGTVVLSKVNLAGMAGMGLDDFLGTVAPGLRGVASNRHRHVAVVVTVQEPSAGWDGGGPLSGPGFAGDRVVRVTPDGTMVEIRA